jgi:hypothetical protein
MTQLKRVKAASTHFPNTEKVKVTDSDFGVENHQQGAQMLSYPETDGKVSTHSADDLKFTGDKKVKAALSDPETSTSDSKKIAEIPNEVDPAVGYLSKEAGLPVIQNVAAEAEDEEEFDGEETINADDEAEKEIDDDYAEEVFADDESDKETFVEEDVEASDDEDFQDLEDIQVGEPEEMEADLEEEDVREEYDQPDADAVAIVDVDAMDDTDADECVFASIDKVVHVIRSNRIIASMSSASAKKAGMKDVYMSTQYQDVVAHAIAAKGIRKGLVQSGFVLAKVKLTSSKVQAKVINAKVSAAVAKRVEASANADKAFDQSLAIAAVGINRRFFKDSPNELKAGLETELQRLGVRGGANIVRAMFAKYGVDYARGIVTLAKKLSAMPEEHRNQFAEALDLTVEDGTDIEADGEEDEVMVQDEFEAVPNTMTAALLRPAVRSGNAKQLTASSSAMSILMGNQSLV